MTTTTPKRRAGRPHGSANTTNDQYPRCPHTPDFGLVGRTECIRLAGLDPTTQRGRIWWSDALRARRFPPADGPTIDGRPTWRRDTMLVALLGWVHRDGTPYLAAELVDEAKTIAARTTPCPGGHGPVRLAPVLDLEDRRATA